MHHHGHKRLEVHFWNPAQLFTSLRRITDQKINFSRTEETWVLTHIVVPVIETNFTKCQCQELFDGVSLACCQDVIIGFVLLQHQPHATHIVTGKTPVAPRIKVAPSRSLYAGLDPITTMDSTSKVALLEKVERLAKAKDKRIVQVMASVSTSWDLVLIADGEGTLAADVRPLVRFNVSVVVKEGDRRETGSFGTGGRFAYERVLGGDTWKRGVDEALRQALVNLGSVPAPAGEMEVVLGPGWPGILLHEAIGHGLEGDYNRKKTSAFAGLLGQRIAAPGVTVVDDGTLPDRRGSLTVDDEGTPSGRTTLIEDGVLVGFLQDRQNARLMGVAPTGNGRRQSYAHAPMPRMTNTVMLGGAHTPEEVLGSVKRGITQ